MWHIIAIGYIFTTLMFSIAQPSLARMLIYLVFWTILPTVFMFWVVMIRRRNQAIKRAEQQEFSSHKEQEHESHSPD